MKNITLFLFCFLIGSAFSQVDGIVIEVEGGGSTDYSGGQTYNVIAPTDNTYEFNFLVKNNTGSSQDWYITRNKINVAAGWADGCCWGHSTDTFGGTCFNSQTMDMPSWTMQSTYLFTLLDGEYGKLKPQVNPADGVTGSSHYRYFIGKDVNGAIVQMDSVNLVVDRIVGISTVSPSLSVSIVPNPAYDFINLSYKGTGSKSVEIYDVLGNKISSAFVEKSTQNIDVSNYKNGIYFVNIKSSNKKAITRKLLIRH